MRSARATRPAASLRKAWQALACGALVLLGGGAPAFALEEPPGEKEALKDCEKRLCGMILGKEPAGPDLSCKLSKTWGSSSLKNGESKGVSWGFGDARCATDINLARAEVVSSLTKPKHTLNLKSQSVRCEVERSGELKPVRIKLAPRLEFERGRADKVWINLEEIEGPEDVKGTVWAAANLEDTIGIFHKPMIKAINKFMHRQCAKRYGPNAEAEAEKNEKRKERKRDRAKAGGDDKKADRKRAADATGDEPATAAAAAAP